LDLSVRVLTSVYWPVDSQLKICTLPPSAEQAFKHFEQYYMGKHNGRKISLNPGLGTADVKAIFFPTGSAKLAAMQEVGDEDLASQQVI